MAKRFIDTSMLPKAFRKLEPNLKLTWFYIWTNCDKAGVWEIDEDLFEFENGIEFQKEKFIKSFGELIEFSGEKILLKDFLRVNYGDEIKENYNPHKPVLRAITQNNLKLEPSLNQACFKLVDEDEEEKEDEEENKKRIVKEKKPKVSEPEICLPWETENFRVQWQHWKIYKKKEQNFKYKTPQSEQAALKKLNELANGDEKTAIQIIHESMANGWKGFFALKNNANGKTQQNGNYSDEWLRKKAESLAGV